MCAAFILLNHPVNQIDKYKFVLERHISICILDFSWCSVLSEFTMTCNFGFSLEISLLDCSLRNSWIILSWVSWMLFDTKLFLWKLLYISIVFFQSTTLPYNLSPHPPNPKEVNPENLNFQVESIVLSIISMLSSPNDESPANVEAAVSVNASDTSDYFKHSI